MGARHRKRRAEKSKNAQQSTTDESNVMDDAKTVTVAVHQLFERYANKPADNLGPDRIGPHGVFALLEDLGLAPTDRKVLILAWLLKAKIQCEFTADEWNYGLVALRVVSIDDLRMVLEKEERILEKDTSKLKALYRFTYTFGKPEHHRKMDCETAIVYWKILFEDRYALLDVWISFLRVQQIDAIKSDIWNLVLEFFEQVDANLSNYDDEAAWPVLLTDFVEHIRKEKCTVGTA
ncbi:unnamed protein product, partial [Mesorhabditis belari]|uniref:Defective in cullin neddylation protein n=1 Tax=Mesorhabditis belari TaxID=2138241 RepID=A0AAF3ETU5_9BILA